MTAPSSLVDALRDRYVIERELGRGGMATVYLARDLKHDRLVALKLLRSELSAVIGVQRFLQEIKVTAGLQHPHILPLFDSGEAEGQVFYVMPYVKGESLRELLTRERQLSIPESVRIATEIARALHYAHRHGVIHRDIKPENILLDEDGQALVADFGIARALSSAGATRVTETGLSLGTPAYMSPEQATAARELDARSDIYSLGAVLYELLTGEPPHSGATIQAIVAKLLTERPTLPRTIRDTVPERLNAAVMRALAKTPADRYATAKEFSEAIALPAAAELQPSEQRRGLTIAAILAAVGTVIALLLLGRGAPRAITAPTLRPVTTTGSVTAPALSPDGRMIAYISQGSRLVVQDLAGGGDPLPVISDALSLKRPKWSPDGATLFSLARLKSGAAGVFAVPRLGGAPRVVAAANVAFAIHPKGDRLVASHFDPAVGGSLTVVRMDDGSTIDTLLRVAAPRSGLYQDWSDSLPFLLFEVEWSPDGRWIAFAGWRQDEDWWGAVVGILSADGTLRSVRREWVIGNIQWGPGSDAIYYFPDHTAAELDLIRLSVDPGTGSLRGEPVVVLSRIPGLNGSISIAGDGRTAAYVTGSANRHVWAGTFDFKRMQLTGRQVTTGTAWHGHQTIAGDGRTIAYAKGDQRGDNIYVAPFDGGPETAVTATADFNHAPSLSPDGSSLVFTRATPARDRRVIMLADVPSGRARPLALPGVFWSQATWVSDSSLLLPTAPNNRHFILHTITTDRRLDLTLPDSLEVRPLISFDPGGQYVNTTVAPVISPQGDAIALTASVRGRESIYTGTLSGSGWRRVAMLPPGEQAHIPRWTDDGWIYFVHGLEGDSIQRLSRVRASGGALELNIPLPRFCLLTGPQVSRDMRRVVCRSSTDPTWDIWLAEGFDSARE